MFSGNGLGSEGELAFALDPSLQWVPPNGVAHILAVENGAAYLKQHVGPLLTPAHVSVAVEDMVVEAILAQFVPDLLPDGHPNSPTRGDRKSTRLNSSHG